MQVIDTHCDVLYKLQQNKFLSFRDSHQLQANLTRLRLGNVVTQMFAIFLPPNTFIEEAWKKTVEQINIFHEKIVEPYKDVVHITSWNEFLTLPENKLGAILTLEGAESIGNNLAKLTTLHDYGILSVGLTWNEANLCADGVLEPRGAGLTKLGMDVVKKNNENNVLTDISHLSEAGFWEVVELAEYPFASHVNVYTCCEHKRNLTDNQLKKLIELGAPIHLSFYPPFIQSSETATINDLMAHIEHICSLGGAKNIGFGSDFDGIDDTLPGLTDASCYASFINKLLTYYSEADVRNFTGENFSRYIGERFIS